MKKTNRNKCLCYKVSVSAIILIFSSFITADSLGNIISRRGWGYSPGKSFDSMTLPCHCGARQTNHQKCWTVPFTIWDLRYLTYFLCQVHDRRRPARREQISICIFCLRVSSSSQLAVPAIFLLTPLCLRQDGGDSPVTAGPHLQHSSWEHHNLPDSRFYRGNSSKLTGRRMWPVGINNIMKTCCSNIRVEINSCHFSGALHRLQRQTDTWTTK